MPNQENNIHAVRDFWQNANVIKANTVIIVKASVVYTDLRTNKILYRSEEPIDVYIDTVNDYDVIVPDLPNELGCFGRFSTYRQEMKYEKGILTIKGKGNPDVGKNSYAVTLI